MIPKKRFSQNFLTNQGILKSITKLANVKDRNVIEIGPGKGALTKYLIDDSKSVLAFELDNDLVRYLDELKKSSSNFDYVLQDFLTVDIDKYSDHIVVGNIPYNITSKIVYKLIKSNINNFTLLVQKEYADRLCAKPHSSEYGYITALSNLFGEFTRLLFVGRKNFYPSPKVDSELISFKRHDKQKLMGAEEEFESFLKQAFSQKRKYLTTNLSGYNGYTKNELITLFANIGILPSARAEELDTNTFLTLFDLLKRKCRYNLNE